MTHQPDMFSGEGDQGHSNLESAGQWKHKARAIATAALGMADEGLVITSEAFRKIIEREIGPPPDPNAWGPLTKWLKRMGWLKEIVEKPDNSPRPSSHGRKLPKYRVLRGRQ